MKKLKKTKASVLVFALIILFIGIAAAIGIASSTMISQKNSINTASSTQSFQVADSGAEIVLNKIKNASDGDTLGSLGLSCSSGVITGNIGTGKEYKITAFRIDESNPITDCSASLSDIDRIKSIGSYKNTNRAVEVAVASGGCKFGKMEKREAGRDSSNAYTAETDGFIIATAYNSGEQVGDLRINTNYNDGSGPFYPYSVLYTSTYGAKYYSATLPVPEGTKWYVENAFPNITDKSVWWISVWWMSSCE